MHYKSSDTLKIVAHLLDQGLRQWERLSRWCGWHKERSVSCPRDNKRWEPLCQVRGHVLSSSPQHGVSTALWLCRSHRWENSCQLRLRWARVIGRRVSCRTMCRYLVPSGNPTRHRARCPALTVTTSDTVVLETIRTGAGGLTTGDTQWSPNCPDLLCMAPMVGWSCTELSGTPPGDMCGTQPWRTSTQYDGMGRQFRISPL